MATKRGKHQSTTPNSYPGMPHEGHLVTKWSVLHLKNTQILVEGRREAVKKNKDLFPPFYLFSESCRAFSAMSPLVCRGEMISLATSALWSVLGASHTQQV